jgi:hypothetical protein
VNGFFLLAKINTITILAATAKTIPKTNSWGCWTTKDGSSFGFEEVSIDKAEFEDEGDRLGVVCSCLDR